MSGRGAAAASQVMSAERSAGGNEDQEKAHAGGEHADGGIDLDGTETREFGPTLADLDRLPYVDVTGQLISI